MEIYTRTINLDFAQKGNPKKIFAKQGDRLSRQLLVLPTINGVSFQIVDTAKVRFACQKADKTQVLTDEGIDIESTRGEGILVLIPESVMTAAGFAICEIIIEFDNGAVISSENFIIDVVENPLDGSIESHDDYQSFKKILADARGGVTWAIYEVISDTEITEINIDEKSDIEGKQMQVGDFVVDANGRFGQVLSIDENTKTALIKYIFRANGSIDIVQEAGEDERKVMSQKAVTNESKSTRTAFFDTNCAELVSLFGLKPYSEGGVTFTPSDNGRIITTSGTALESAQYYLFRQNIDGSVFTAGCKYHFKYVAPKGCYFQVLSNDTDVVVNDTSFDGTKEFVVPLDTTKLTIRLYCPSSAELGKHQVSITNERNLDYLEETLFYERMKTKDFLNMVGLTSDNLLEGVNTVSGHYVNYLTGTLVGAASFSTTDYFSVFPNVNYRLSYRTNGSQIAFYDGDKKYVSGLETTANEFKLPNDDRIRWARWCAPTSSVSNWGLYVVPVTKQNTKYITESEGILSGVIDAYNNNINKIVVKSGAYDIIAEYKEVYGEDYFDNYANNYNGKANGYFDCGVWLDNIDIYFESGASVTAHYEGDNSQVKTWFSAFAMGQNVTLDGLVLDASNLRYGLHPDFHTEDAERLVIRNCDLHHYKPSVPSVNDNQAIGAGLGVYSDWLIENCVFRSDTSNAVLRIHNNYSSRSVSKLMIKNCYIVGDGHILLNSYSTSTKETTALVTGCSWKNPAVVGKETSDSIDNIMMLAWNNEERA